MKHTRELKIEYREMPVESSQGGRYDRPPEDWIRSELVKFGALDAKVQGPTLVGELHPIFQRDNWPYLSKQRYDALYQSMLLSSKLLEIAMPYFASFLPNVQFQRPPNEHRIVLKPRPTESEISQARKELRDLAPEVHFEEDPLMWPSSKGWLGITSTGLGRPEEPFEVEPEFLWRCADHEDQRVGCSHRHLTVGIASQFADALISSNKKSDQYLRAAFMAGITLTHEIGHVVYNRNFDREVWWGEAWVGRDVEMELGNALIAWLFDGWTPAPINLGEPLADMHSFKTGLCWQKHWRRPLTRPNYRTVYSIPMTHIQRIMSQEEWAHFDQAGDQSIAVRQQLLGPITPFKKGEHARVAWKINQQRWMFSNSFRDFEPRDTDSDMDAYEDDDWDDGELDIDYSAYYSNTEYYQPARTRSPQPHRPTGAQLQAEQGGPSGKRTRAAAAAEEQQEEEEEEEEEEQEEEKAKPTKKAKAKKGKKRG